MRTKHSFLRTASRILYSGQHFESSVWLQICERRRRHLISWNGSFAWGDGWLINDYNLEEYIIEIPLECLVQDSIMDDFFGSSEIVLGDFSERAILCRKNEDSLRLI